MKKFLSMLLVLSLLLSVTACGDNTVSLDVGGNTAAENDNIPEDGNDSEKIENENKTDSENTDKTSIYVPVELKVFDGDGGLLQEGTYTYDKNGNLTLVKYTEGEHWRRFTHTYNSDGFLSKTVESADGEDTCVENFDYRYDDKGRLVEETCTHVHDHSTYKYVKTYVYDNNDNIEKMGNGSDDDLTYTTYVWDSEGKLVEEKTDNDTVTYTYDEKGNLLSEKRAWSASEWSDAGESVVNYIYDENGNLIEYSWDGSDIDWGKQTYTYDEKGRVVSCVREGSVGKYWENIYYTYEDDGTRIAEYRDNGDGTVLHQVREQLKTYSGSIPDNIQNVIEEATDGGIMVYDQLDL